MNLSQFLKISDMFPLMRSVEFETLKMDIATHGQREPICLYECKTLDGSNPVSRLLSSQDRAAIFVVGERRWPRHAVAGARIQTKNV
jgi:hypothetical protein